MNKKVYSLIAARGGSQGIPGKNLKSFCGKPLLAWAVESSRQCNSIQKTIVSTDSEEIAKVARDHGANVPFVRPSNLATSTIGIEPTIQHLVNFLAETKDLPDYLALLPVTNPLRTSDILEECIKTAVEGNYDCVMTVNQIPANHSPFWCLVERESKVSFYYEKDLNSRFSRRQDFPAQCYARNDLAYIFKPQNFMDGLCSLYGTGDKVKLFETPAYFDGDINTEDEWKITENLFNYLRTKNKS